MEILLATSNNGKAKEIEFILNNALPDRVVTLKTLKDFPDITTAKEDEFTYRENAKKKAMHIAEQTGMITLADDSGLEVDLLGGIPGVHSARLAGANATDDENIDKLLLLINSKGSPIKAAARFRTVICLVTKDQKVFFSQGVCEGNIIQTRKGNNGFGYDPVFYVDSLQKTFAEALPEEKNSISHRTKAVINMVPIINSLF